MLPLPLEDLQCPATGLALRESVAGLESADGTHSYPVAHGVPILIAPEFSVFDVSGIADGEFTESRPSLLRRAVRAARPSRSLPGDQRRRYTEFVGHVLRSSPDRRPRVLVVGGGTLGQGAEPLADSAAIDLVETDVFVSSRTTIVCDGHHLPFVDETFDGVVVQAVLEHVLDPVRVVSELHRVLRPGGIVYAETPFMQQVHEGAYDFTRWTESGHRRLFRMFAELDRGVVAGPGTALLWSLCYFARSVPRRRSLVLVADNIVLMLFFWLKYLDRLILDHPAASDGASGVFFLGSRQAVPVPDREVLEGYRGAVGRSVRRV